MTVLGGREKVIGFRVIHDHLIVGRYEVASFKALGLL